MPARKPSASSTKAAPPKQSKGRVKTSPAPTLAKNPAARTPAQAGNAGLGKESASARVEKVEKPKKLKLIRDSFTMPSFDYDLIKALKLKALDSKTVIKKSELLRAGLHALNKLDTKELINIVSTLAVLKTGRPKK
jgi:hypothetical protein